MNQLVNEQRLQFFAGPLSIFENQTRFARLAVGAEFECPGEPYGTRAKTFEQFFDQSDFQIVDPSLPRIHGLLLFQRFTVRLD